MNRLGLLTAIAIPAMFVLVPSSRAAVNVERQGSENAIIEVAKSMGYGALGGMLLGTAIAYATNDDDDNGDYVRWGFVSGTFIGLGYGLYQVTHRPAVTTVIEVRDGAPSLHAALPMPEPGHDLALRLVTVRF
jgi:hypothetical protein